MTFHIDSIEILIKFKHDDGGYNEARQYIQVHGAFPLDSLTGILVSEFQGLCVTVDKEARKPCPYYDKDPGTFAESGGLA